MKYTNDSGDITEYDVETLYDKDSKPFALIILEAKGSQAEVSLELVEKAASSIFRSEGNQTVFLEKENGNYLEMRINISLDSQDNTRFLADIEREPLECSKNLVEFFQEKASFITSTNQERNLEVISRTANEDQVIKR